MRKLLPLLLLILIGCSPDPNKPINGDELGFNSPKDLYYYENIFGKTTPYSGSIFFLDSLGDVILEGNLNNGKKEGIFKSYDSGLLLSEQNYKNGKLDGLSTFYNDNEPLIGRVIQKSNYKDGIQDGITTTYHINSQMNKSIIRNPDTNEVINLSDKKFPSTYFSYREDTYKNGLLNGVSTSYDRDNRKFLETNYRNGKEVGPLKRFENDRLLYQLDVNEDGKCYGNYVSYYPNGNKESEGKRMEGDCSRNWDDHTNYSKTREGFWTFWYENGNKSYEGSYTHNSFRTSSSFLDTITEVEQIKFEPSLKTGLWIHWDTNGQILSETEYQYDMYSGKSKMYNNNGKLSSIMEWGLFEIDGKLKSIPYGEQVMYWTNGNKMDEWYYGSPYPLFSTEFMSFKVDSCPDNKVTCYTLSNRTYYEDGSQWSYSQYKNGKRHGTYYEYWKKNGNIYKSVEYKNDKKHGTTKYYSRDEGIHWRTIIYRNDIKISDDCSSCESE